MNKATNEQIHNRKVKREKKIKRIRKQIQRRDILHKITVILTIVPVIIVIPLICFYSCMYIAIFGNPFALAYAVFMLYLIDRHTLEV